jgi:Family of unknown function (DUF5343)
MNTNIEKVAPYAPFGCVIAVVKRIRERGLPEILTMQEITRVGVSEGNASRTLQALKFLKLVDEDGHRTQIFDRLGRVPTNEYAEVFGEIIKEAYSDVFTIVDPAEATDVEINDAFRYYQPQAQRGRMVTLFRGLCQEVGLVDGGPPETRKRTRAALTDKPSMASHSATFRKPQIETSYTFENTGILNGNSTGIWQEYALLQGLLQQLPSNKEWTQERRDRWLQAFTASVDFLIDIEPEG